jgi:LPS export ABC transporter protein LptC
MPRPLLQVLLALTLLLAAKLLWDPRPGSVPDEQTSRRLDVLPKTYVEQVQTWSFDENGNLKDMVEAERVDQYSRGDYSTMVEPRLYSHSEDGKTWSMSAERGRYQHEEEQLLLRRNVVLSHDQTGSRMRTHMLDVQLAQRTARGDRQVTIVQGDNRTTADGLYVDLEQETVLLRPNVQTLYVPPPDPKQR